MKPQQGTAAFPPPPSAYPGDPPQLIEAQQLAQQAARALPPTSPLKKLVANRFKQATELKALLVSRTHPLTQEGEKLASAIQLYIAERGRYDESGLAYQDEQKRYSGTPITPENRQQMAAWRGLLDKKRDEGLVWMQKLEAEDKHLRTWRVELGQKLDKLWQDWLLELDRFVYYAKQGIRLGEVDAELDALEKQLATDRIGLDRYRTSLPGFHEEVEKMARQAEETRKAGAEAAFGFGVSLAIDSLAVNSSTKQALTQKHLKETRDILIRKGTPPEQAKAILRNWKGGNAVVQEFKSEREFIENLSKLVDYGGITEGALRQQYWETAVAILSLFLQTPLVKLVKANTEIWTSLLYTGLSVQQAKARVEQFSKLGDAQLRAVQARATLYEKHLRRRRTLLAERAELTFGEDFPQRPSGVSK